MSRQSKLSRVGILISLATGGFLAVLVSILFLINMSQGAFIYSLLSLVPKPPLQGTNILAVGIDETKYVQRSDTILVLHLDKEKQRIGVISIPRDTRIVMPNIGTTKINHAYAEGKMPLMTQTVSSFLNIPIHHYIKIDLNGIESLVESVGGIPLFVEKDLVYHDKAADLHIDIKKGEQLITSENVSGYLRFRHDNQGDIGRIRRQQTFLRAFSKRLLSEKGIVKSTSFLSHLKDMVETDLSIPQLLSLSLQFSKAHEVNNIHTGTVPGAVTLDDGVSYWTPNISGLDKIIEKTFFGFDDVRSVTNKMPIAQKTSALASQGSQTAKKNTRLSTTTKKKGSLTVETHDKTAQNDHRRHVTLQEVSRVTEQVNPKDQLSRKVAKDQLRIEVLNGNGLPGIAKTVSTTLKSMGFNVVRFDNSGSFNYDKTLIVDWKSNVQNTLVLTDLLHIDPRRIIVYDRPKKTLDITIVIGKDWQSIFEKIAGVDHES